MNFIPESDNMIDYLKATGIIDYDTGIISDIGDILAIEKLSDIEIAKEVYEYVRDRISHSGDIDAGEVTCKASEVLAKRHGICCAKSHLLAALLRYKGIPCGFCYQKLYAEDGEEAYMAIHGLNAVFLSSIGRWVRLDARGNKEGVNAAFSIEEEKIAWPVNRDLGEEDIPVIYTEPNKDIVNVLMKSKNRNELDMHWRNTIQYIFD